MAQSFVTDAGTLIIPGSYPEITVAPSNSGLSTTGVLIIVGEADAGADFASELDLGKNSFGPDQEAKVLAKYKSGNIVDAFRAAIVAANDPDIKGTFSSAILVKTNASAKAFGPLSKWDSTYYGTLQDKSFGQLGNLISYKVSAKTPESVPSTGPFALLGPTVATVVGFRPNGGALQTITIGVNDIPPTTVTAINGLTGVKATGGVDRGVIAGVGGPQASLAIVSGNSVHINYSVNFSGTPKAGDSLYIPAASALADSNPAAAGQYIVTAASGPDIFATKLLDISGAHNALTPPTAHAAVELATTDDVLVYSPVVILLPDNVSPIDGVGKSLEISCPNAASLADIARNPDGTACTFFSTPSRVKVLASVSEYSADLAVARQADGINEDLVAGGKVVLTIGYVGTTGTAVNDGTNLTITVVGGAGVSPDPLPLKHYKTVADLAAKINSLTGFTAAPGTAVLGSQSPSTLDVCSVHIATTFGGAPGRIKQDGSVFYNLLRTTSQAVQLQTEALSGLPAPTPGFSFLSGGTLGATTDAIFSAAMDKLKLVRGNFVIPLFSRDATGDVADGLTDPSSTYTIAAIHSYARAHVLSVSTMKARRNRQAFLSILDTFDNCKAVAANLASYRCACTFQDVNDTGANGVEQFQPWMAAVKAAAMQAGGFYKAIFNKGIAISGAAQAAGDFSDQDDTAMEEALEAGLLPIRANDNGGGFHFTSDQTTYGADDNFVFNSIQAVYAADTIALTTAQRMERAFVGQNIADISASLAKGTLEAIMADLLRLKLIAVSDDAPKGFKNPQVQIQGPAMVVSIQVKLAGAIYFIPISFQITQVTQTA